MKKTLLVVLVCFGIQHCLNAQMNADTLKLKFERLTIDDGLSQGMVLGITQDKRGFMWFATKDGLNKYDGYHFKVYYHNEKDTNSIASSNIFSVTGDDEGLLWITYFDQSMDIFNPETEVAYHLTRDLEKSGYNKTMYWNFTAIKNNTAYLTNSDGRSSYFKIELTRKKSDRGFGYSVKATNLTHRLPVVNSGADYNGAFISSENKLYLSYKDTIVVCSDADISKEIKVSRYHYTKFSQVKVGSNTVMYNKPNSINVCAEDTVHHCLVSSSLRVFSIYDEINDVKTDSCTVEKICPTKAIVDYTIDNDHRFWINVFLTNPLLYDPRSRKMSLLVSEDENIKNHILANVFVIFNDRSGTVWLGTNGYGLLKYNTGIDRFHHVAGSGNEAFSIYEIWEDPDKKSIWLYNSAETLSRFDRDKNVHTIRMLSDNERAWDLLGDHKLHCEAFSVDKKGYWLIRVDSLYYMNRSMDIVWRSRLQKSPAIAGAVSAKDTKGNMWIATGFEKNLVLHKLNEDSASELNSYWFPVEKTTIQYPFTSAILADENDNLWLGTVEGLFFFNTKSETWMHYKHSASDTASLPVNIIFSLCPDAFSKNILWIGTSGGGLVKFDRTNGKCITYTTENGLPNNVIYGILFDKHGNLWMSTNNGIARFNPSTKEIKLFTARDGLQSNEFNRYSYCRLQSGEMVFGGVNGINIFNPDEINENPFQPDVLLTGFKIGNKEVTVHTKSSILQKAIFATPELHLDYTQNYITFSFSSTDYSGINRNHFQYQLSGLSDEWSPATKLNEVSYTNLNPGSYTFRVRGTNSDGVWSKKEAAIAIYISPPWWATWWFRGLVILSIAAAVYTLYRYRLQQALKLQKLRSRIATDLHDEIGSTLSSVSLYTEAAKKMLNGNEPAHKVLAKINSNTTEMMEAMSDIVWAVNTRNDKLDNLVNRMRSFAVQVSESKNFELHFEENKNIPDMPLDMVQRKNLYLIFKEVINNAAKYAECKNLWVEFSKKNNVLEMTIRDDGKGFETGEPVMQSRLGESMQANRPSLTKSGGNGLVNMKKRADDLKATLRIISEIGKGTKISLLIKL